MFAPYMPTRRRPSAVAPVPLALLAMAALLAASACPAPGQPAAGQPAADDGPAPGRQVPAPAAPRYEVVATGQAPAELPNAKEAAIEDALRQAVASAGGVKLISKTEVEGMALVNDYVITESCGIVETYVVLVENPNQDGLFTVRVKAVVVQARPEIATRVKAFQALIRRKGRAKMLLVGSVDRKPFDEELTQELQGKLEDRGFSVLHLGMLGQRQRDDMQRQIELSGDARLAARIASEVGANYYMIVTSRVTPGQPVTAAGQTLYPFDVRGTVEVVRPDTALILASTPVSEKKNFRDPVEGRRELVKLAARRSMDKAIERLAKNWLEDVDGAGGQQIELVLTRFPFDRVAGLAQSLRLVPGVTEVRGDETDQEGRTFLRVITNSSSFDVGAVLKQIDPSLNLVRSSRYRVEIDGTVPPPPAAPDGLRRRVVMWVGVGAAGALTAVLAVIAVVKRRVTT